MPEEKDPVSQNPPPGIDPIEFANTINQAAKDGAKPEDVTKATSHSAKEPQTHKPKFTLNPNATKKFLAKRAARKEAQNTPPENGFRPSGSPNVNDSSPKGRIY